MASLGGFPPLDELLPEMRREGVDYGKLISDSLTDKKGLLACENHHNPLYLALDLLREIGSAIEIFNQVVEEQIRPLGYWQVPAIEGVCGYSEEDSGGRGGGTHNVSIENLAKRISVGPIQRDSYYLGDPALDIRRSKSKGRIPHKPKDQSVRIIEVLGREPSWECTYCKLRGDPQLGPDARPWHIDHMYPQAAGGDSHRDNLVLACATCNLSKGAKRLKDFLATLEVSHAGR